MAKTDWQMDDTVMPDDMNQLGQEINELKTIIDNNGRLLKPVRLAASRTTAQLNGLRLIQDVQLVEGDRVLIFNIIGSNQLQLSRGIYTVSAGDWTRADDAQENTRVPQGTAVPVLGGIHTGKIYLITDEWIVGHSVMENLILQDKANHSEAMYGLNEYKYMTPATTKTAIESLAPIRRTARFVIGTSNSGWTNDEVDYLCDGINDEIEINAAIAALPDNGGEIIVLDGTYNIANTIQAYKTNIRFRGNGDSTILRRMFQSNDLFESILRLGGNYSSVEHLRIDGNNEMFPSEFNVGIYCNHTRFSLITKVTCINNAIGIYFRGNYNTITGNILSGNGTGITGDAIQTTVSGNVFVLNNIGIDVSGHNILVHGNRFRDNETGIYSERRNIITSNEFTRNGGYASNQYTIYLNGNQNLVSSNLCIGKDVVDIGEGNMVVNNLILQS